MAFRMIFSRQLYKLQVSWIRYKDTSLLTVGRYTYTTDLRFEAIHSPHTDDWIVVLKNPRPTDSGIYGCQISTTPHRTQLIYLTVHGKLKIFTLKNRYKPLELLKSPDINSRFLAMNLLEIQLCIWSFYIF